MSNTTLLVLKSLSPLSVSYMYLLKTERSSSGVRINDLAYSQKVLYISLNIGLSRQGREVFRSDWTKRYKRDEVRYFYVLPASGL